MGPRLLVALKDGVAIIDEFGHGLCEDHPEALYHPLVI
jgi:hypothetical protein